MSLSNPRPRPETEARRGGPSEASMLALDLMVAGFAIVGAVLMSLLR